MEQQFSVGNEHFCVWQGGSGQGYFHSIYPIDFVPSVLDRANFILARMNEGADDWEPLYIGTARDVQMLYDNPKTKLARTMGATHCHIHLLAGDWEARQDVMKDLRRQWPTPIADHMAAPLLAIA